MKLGDIITLALAGYKSDEMKELTAAGYTADQLKDLAKAGYKPAEIKGLLALVDEDAGGQKPTETQQKDAVHPETAKPEENPAGAAAVTRALQKAAAYVEAEPRAAAQLQIENDYVAGDLDFNAALLEELFYQPSRSLGKKTFEAAARQLQEAGVLKASTNIDKFIEDGYIELYGVPDGYTYDSATKTYHEINGSRA